MAGDFESAEKCLLLLREVEKSETAYSALKDLDPSIANSAGVILKELRETKVHLERAHAALRQLPAVVEHVQQAIRLLAKAKDFTDTINSRRKSD